MAARASPGPAARLGLSSAALLLIKTGGAGQDRSDECTEVGTMAGNEGVHTALGLSDVPRTVSCV
jgi:hypothetical protein